MADSSVGNWIPSCQSLRSHSKRKRLSRLLGIGLHETVGLLNCLWWWVLDEADNGDLAPYSNQDIADGADWEGDADKLIAALVDAGFMFESRSLVNWWKYVGNLVDKRNAKREADRVRQDRYRKSLQERVSGMSDGHGGVTHDSDVTGDIVAGDSPASHAAVARGAQEGGQSPSEAAPSPPKLPVEPPEALVEFDARLRKMPGYNPSADFYRLVLEKYGRLDLNEQAFLMTEWQGDPQRNKKKRKGTTLFVVSWLKRTLADAPIQFAAQGSHRNGSVGGAAVATAPDAAWDGAMLLDDDEPPPGIDLDDAFRGTDGRA